MLETFTEKEPDPMAWNGNGGMPKRRKEGVRLSLYTLP